MSEECLITLIRTVTSIAAFNGSQPSINDHGWVLFFWPFDELHRPLHLCKAFRLMEGSGAYNDNFFFYSAVND